tara:strand:+ start:1714 stop:2493 length:780 start_codon:yes stop_codon:yes gene_type:complete
LPGALPAGHLIAGRFSLEASVGRGGQGVVYRALDLQTHQPCAVKLSRRRRYRRATPLLAKLHHPRVQELLGWGSEGGLDYLVFRLYSGSDLQALVKSAGPLEAGRVRALGAQLFTTLSHLHKGGVIHRDVKPSNVMLAGRRLVLIDFDLATRIGEIQPRGRLIGTPLYMSNELLSGRAAGPADDIFAGAVSLFELARGTLPTATSAPKNIEELRAARRAPLESLGALDGFFKRALSPDPHQRFDSALAAAVALTRSGVA